MKNRFPVLVLLLQGCALSAQPPGELPSAPRAFAGFTAERAAAHRQLEARLDTSIASAPIDAWMDRLTARPHHVGAPHSRANAEWMAELFRSWGFETRLESFPTLFPTPRERHLEMLAPEPFTARLAEPPLDDPKLAAQADEILPPYNAFSPDGDVTADVVYVGYGRPQDYDTLARHRIDVAGKVVLARYGRTWRGIKPRAAAQRGAIGCLIYHDPADYGWAWGETFPEGGWFNGDAVERGSVSDFTAFAGDLLTPGVGAPADLEAPPPAKITELPGLAAIPTLPIGWNDAEPLLRALRGPMAPLDWRGGLPFPYRLGPGPTRVRLKLAFNWQIVLTWNVLATLPGAELPDQWILRGNHHDAWVYGAGDPVSGMTSLLAEARAVGHLAKAGWRPRRTLIYAAWDGEEPGLRGAVEWAETHAEELDHKAVAYLNTDGLARGVLRAQGSPTLAQLVDAVAREVRDPHQGTSLYERDRAQRIVHGGPGARERLQANPSFPLAPAGGGSDHVPFLHHLGIASLFVFISGEEDGDLSHSAYDTPPHYRRWIDPDQAYGRTLAQVTGRLALRLAEADILPLDPSGLADSLQGAIAELEAGIASLAAARRERLLREEEGSLLASSDPLYPERVAPPVIPPEPPRVDVGPLHRSIAALERAGSRYRRALASALENGTLSLETRREVDRTLMRLERALLRPEGLPGRPWWRHQLYAPGVDSGYRAGMLPGVHTAVGARDGEAAAVQIEVVASMIDAVTELVIEAAEQL